MNLIERLEKVEDRESFMAFVWALIEDRKKAEKLELEEPDRYKYGAALGWQNSAISDFLSAAVSYLEDDSTHFDGDSPSWRDMATFIYMGKIYE